MNFLDAIQKQNLIRLFTSVAAGLEVPPDISVSEWADTYRMLPATSNLSGKWKTENTPHLREMMDAFSDPDTEEITVIGSAQVAKTSFLENCIGYTIHINPQPILYLGPTIDVAKKFSSAKLDPMLEDTKVLRDRVAVKRSRDSSNTKLFKEFTGGFIVFVGGNSPHGLRQMSIPVILSDDIDSIEMGMVKEGDPVLRAEKRSQTFEGSSKKVRVSTPTRKGLSRIEKFFQEGSRERYHVECEECEEAQVLKFENMEWEKETDMFGNVVKEYPETATIKCAFCGHKYDETGRRRLLAKGYWVAEVPQQKHRSFAINEVSSTLSTLTKIARARVEAGDDAEKIEVFTNLVLGESFETSEKVEYDMMQLMERCESYMSVEYPFVPEGVLMLTMGVDVQKDRLEYQVCGWGKGEECWVLYYDKIYGETDQPEVWEELTRARRRLWRRGDGYDMRIARTLVDSGYQQGKSKIIYEYAATYARENVMASKGYGGYGKKLFEFSKVWNKSIHLVRIGTNEAKAALFEVRLKIEKPGPKYIHFTQEYCDFDYFTQLTNEVGFVRYNGNQGYIVYDLKKKKLRNEALDTWVMCFIGMAMQPVNWEQISHNMKLKTATKPVDTVPAQTPVPAPKQEEKQVRNYTPPPGYGGGFISNY